MKRNPISTGLIRTLPSRVPALAWAVGALAFAAPSARGADPNGAAAPGVGPPAAVASASNAAAIKTFEAKALPIFAEHCVKCHGPAKQKSELRLDSLAWVAKGGAGGPAVIAGKPDLSRLVLALRYEGDLTMPPSGQLAPELVAAMEEWVAGLNAEDLAGALAASGDAASSPAALPSASSPSGPASNVPSPGAPGAPSSPGSPSSPNASAPASSSAFAGLPPPPAAGADDKYWALRPVVRPEPPEIADADGQPIPNPIDRFLIAKLRAAGLEPSPQADGRTLARRLSLDVEGLPPAASAVNPVAAAMAAGSDAAWARKVDAALASPHYGERWARHWLDIARFAETNGFETNTPRPNAWPYRDYVVKAFNDDLPYNTFIIQQLAGDAFGAPVATGFLVAGAWDEVKSPDRELTLNQRANELHDMISTLSGAFLGMTIGCARCHDHKFDPIKQTDYFAIKAMLDGVNHGERELPPADVADREAKRARLEAELARTEARLLALEPLADPASRDPRRAAVNAAGNVERFAPVAAVAVRFTIEATNSAEPCIDELEVMSAGEVPRNVALASVGGVSEASGSYDGVASHKLEFINDGMFGNGRSWISSQPGAGWVQVSWAKAETIDTVRWARDREGKFYDRLATRYRVEALRPDGEWVLVASSSDRMETGPPANSEAPEPKTVADAKTLRTEPAMVEADAAERRDLNASAESVRREIAGLSGRARVYAGVFTEPEPTRLFIRGDPMRPGDAVGPAGVAAIAPPLALPPDTPERERRIALARWIASRENPLTARVMVNRIWQHHFGEGLVATPSDFGAMGARPSHPELLDWLAAEFMAGNWSVKKIQRLILTSRAYRQSSAPRAEAMKIDAGARLLWRFPPRRLEAEPLRDSILSVSGALDPTMGGPGFDTFEPNTNYVRVYTPKTKFTSAEFRRMIYQRKPRNVPEPTFGVFDCPESAQPAPRRSSSTTPLQLVNLLNSPFMLEQAAMLAARAEREAGGNAAKETPAKENAPVQSAAADPTAAARVAFRLALSREPAPEELEAAAALARERGLPAVCRALFNCSEFLRIE